MAGVGYVASAVLIGTIAGILILVLALAGALFRSITNQIDSLSASTDRHINPAPRKEII